ncbi:MAG: hypothetical protein A3D31_09985 [Candidatus Fluviicola riflensis]|nr:MAG: hypothetical protein CHH17_14400 [Candidatus Fluviicola riflensis]OGS77335.1 MAG: hypothetical protein A3D31_09985 [Candidatus Fluviicola riflensis]OGS82631.1 MAG: hypothetical protein A2724_00095 [Fluviicola sp. RIFCSPHIGHO2_01_FULL_43_53]OGS83914.1 MAG: hypothetical protein A3E30_11385 [Fluviicola sp. RIFCSPHIGHO2_12_FULL_43_24]
MKTILLALIFLTAFSPLAKADSPLTSTDISSSYQDVAIVQTAGTTEGVLTDELMVYLANESNPIDVKMAVINQLSWNFDGKTNAVNYMAYLLKTKNYGTEAKLKKKGTAHDLICMAYLKAMDDYFDVKAAIVYADLAAKKNKKSYTIQLIAGMIKAQQAMDSDWCAVFKLTDAVRNNAGLTVDMRQEAINKVFEYMDLYRDSCQ